MTYADAIAGKDFNTCIRKRQKAGWSFYVVIFGTRIEFDVDLFFGDLSLF
jgi:hypothetical protein